MVGKKPATKKHKPSQDMFVTQNPTDEGGSSDTTTSDLDDSEARDGEQSMSILLDSHSEELRVVESQESQDSQLTSHDSEGTEGSSQTYPSKFTRGTKQVLLTDEMEVHMAEWLQDTVPFVYDKTMDLYKNKAHIARLFEAKAMELSGGALSGKDLKKWFETNRTKYGKLTKQEKSGSGTEQLTQRSKTILNLFQFLRCHINRKRPSSSLGLQQKQVS